MHNTRRRFLMTVAAGSAVIGGAARAQAKVDEKDPQAAAVGYVADATKADTKKFPQYAAGHHCGTCALFQGKANDAAGPCTLFGGKLVASAGWCSAWNKKAA